MYLKSPSQGEISLRDAERPSFDIAQAHGIVKSLYGLSGSLNELPSERDQNYHLIADNGEEFVLKIAAGFEKRETLELQNSGMLHLSSTNTGFESPIVRKSINDSDIETTKSIDGSTYFVPRSVIDGGTMANISTGGTLNYSFDGGHCGVGNKACW